MIELDDGEILDPETAQTLEEFKAQGYEIAGEAKEPQPEVKVEAEPAKPVTQPEPVKEEAKVEDEPEVEKQQVERNIKAVPVKKYNELRHELQDLKKQLAERETQVSQPVTTPPHTPESISKLAEKYQLQPEFLQDLAQSLAEDVGRKVAIPEDYKAVIEQMKQSTKEQQEELGFQREASQVLKEFPQLGDYQSKLKELAYTEGLEKTPLRTIAIQYMHDSGMFDQPKKTAESGKPISGGATELIDYNSVTEEEFSSSA